jgi:hypothetical protein
MAVGTLSVKFVGRITEGTIRNRIVRMFPNKKVEWDKPIGKYISGTSEAIRAFYASINAFDGFNDDGLRMRPGDMQAVGTLRAMSNAIVVRYLKQGWHVSA